MKTIPCILFIATITFIYAHDLADKLGIDTSKIDAKIEMISSFIFV